MSGTVLEMKTMDIGVILILGSKCEWILFEVKDFEGDLQTWRSFLKKKQIQVSLLDNKDCKNLLANVPLDTRQKRDRKLFEDQPELL